MYNYNYQQQTNLDWIMVPTIQQAEQVSVQPGGKAWIMVQNEPVFALRTADRMGLITTEFYRFEKYSPSAPSGDYVTRKQMEDAIASAIKSLKGEEV